MKFENLEYSEIVELTRTLELGRIAMQMAEEHMAAQARRIEELEKELAQWKPTLS